MARMFERATVFNDDINDWDISAVTGMDSMFDGNTAFNQNLGRWYIVSSSIDTYNGGTNLGLVRLATQNQYLTSQNPT